MNKTKACCNNTHFVVEQNCINHMTFPTNLLAAATKFLRFVTFFYCDEQTISVKLPFLQYLLVVGARILLYSTHKLKLKHCY